MRKNFLLLGLALAGTMAAPAWADGNARLGATKITTCIACHGEDGKGILPIYPVIAGQHQEYLAHSLRQYRSGERNNAIMGPMAMNLSDDDIEDLAAYYASLPGPLKDIEP